MADGFLGRWSQRKQALREGRAVDEPALPKAPEHVSGANPPRMPVRSAPSQEAGLAGAAPQTPAPAPTLEDVKALNADSSFAPFVARDVAPEVRNAAMKKLFTDPHYNVMDGLDIYIDDYSKADPLPATMLRQMASAKFLNLFDEDPPPASGSVPHDPTLREDANTAAAGSVAPSALPQDLPDTQAALPISTADVGFPTKDDPHDHTDLRLQPDDAARPEGLERKPE